MGALFALCAAALSVQPVWRFVDPRADLRYYMGALPLLLAMKGLFAEWAWRRSRLAGAAAAAVLLCSSAGAWPFNVPSAYTGERTLGLHLFQFVREIHRPYRDSIRVASDYLLEHAAQDDLVYVPGFADREALTFAAGHRVLFCCVLDDDTPLPPATVASLGPWLAVEGTAPDWIVVFEELSDEYWDKVKARYAIAAQPEVYFYPAQRPELNAHAFTPLPSHQQKGVHILQRRAEHGLQQAADALLRQQRYEEALAAYREALPINADYAPAHAGMGRALFRLERYEAAAEHFERALQLDPRDRQALDHLALVHFRQRRYAMALELYRRLAEVTPDSAQIHANIGSALYYLGRIDEAVGSFEQALALDPALETARSALERIRKAHPRPGS